MSALNEADVASGRKEKENKRDSNDRHATMQQLQDNGGKKGKGGGKGYYGRERGKLTPTMQPDYDASAFSTNLRKILSVLCKNGCNVTQRNVSLLQLASFWPGPRLYLVMSCLAVLVDSGSLFRSRCFSFRFLYVVFV